MVALLDRPAFDQSLGPVVLDRNHALTSGLGFYSWFGHGGPGVDLVSGLGPSTTAGNIGIGAHKGIFNPSGTNLSWQEWSNTWLTSIFASRPEMSLMCRFTQRTTTENKQASFLGICAANGSGFTLIQGVPTAYGAYINGGAQVAYTGLTALSGNITYTLFISAGATNSRIMAFAEGGIVSDVSTSAMATTNAGLSRIRIAGERGTAAGGVPNAGGGYSPVGEVHGAAIWNRRLAIQEMVYLAQNPYALVRNGTARSFAPSSPRSPFRGWGIQLAA